MVDTGKNTSAPEKLSVPVNISQCSRDNVNDSAFSISIESEKIKVTP